MMKNLVQHCASPLLVLADDHGTHHALGNAQDTIQLLGEFRCAGEAHQHIVAFGLVIDGVSKTTLAPSSTTTSEAVLLSQSPGTLPHWRQ